MEYATGGRRGAGSVGSVKRLKRVRLAGWDEIVKRLGGAVEGAVTQQRQPKAALDDAARAAEALLRQE